MAAANNCLQQRDHPHHHHPSYPYMFHDHLQSLSSTYNHSRSPSIAHSQQALNAISSPYNGTSPTTGAGTGTGTGVISPGVSVPVQIPNQSSDISSNYWPRLQ